MFNYGDVVVSDRLFFRVKNTFVTLQVTWFASWLLFLWTLVFKVVRSVLLETGKVVVFLAASRVKVLTYCHLIIRSGVRGRL